MVNRFALVFLFVMIFALPLNAAPAAWQVEGEKGTLIIFGTMHRLPDGANWLSEDLENSLESSRLLVLETENSQASDDYLGYLIRQPGVAKSRKRLKKKLNENDYQTFLSRVTGFGFSEEEVANYRPWYAALLLARLGGEEAGLERGLGVEATLVSISEGLGLEVIGLESPAQQFRVFSTLPKKVELAWLEKILRRGRENGERSQSLYSFWMEGDLQAIENQVLGSLKETAGLYEAFIKRRNQTWADQMEFLLEQGGQVFIAVGTAHMLGEDSVLKMLEARGYKVTRLQ